MVELAGAGLALALCLAASVRALDILAGVVAPFRDARCGAAGLLVGVAAWAQAIVGPGLPATARIDALGAAAALAVAVLGAIAAFAAFRRCKGALRVIGGGAILGAGVALSRGVLLASLGADVDFDDTLFSSGVALASTGSVAALWIFGLRRGVRGRRAAALILTVGLASSAALAGASALIFTPLAPGLPVAGVGLVAGAMAAALLAASYLGPRRLAALRLATRVPAWRGSPRPAPGRRPAGTAWLRPQPGRSVADRGASPARPARPAD
jgi:NO-binding membrane sensor protein with MHYT domain